MSQVSFDNIKTINEISITRTLTNNHKRSRKQKNRGSQL